MHTCCFTTVQRAKHQGFTLIEMSVVLIILGLLVGGILGGKSLIKAAELKGVIREAEQYQLALNNFVLRYEQYPGDMVDATEIWGEADADPTTCKAMDKSGVDGTCNGNGDMEIGGSGAVKWPEHYLFWHHLQKAGLITGEYSGTWDEGCGAGPGNCLYAHTPGLNCPDSAKGENIGWSVYFKDYSDGSEANPNWFEGDYGHIFTYGAKHDWGAAPNRPALGVGEVYYIDMKMDDGLPAKGKLVVRNGEYPDLLECTEAAPAGSGVQTHSDDIDAVYRLSEGDEVHCNMILRNILE